MSIFDKLKSKGKKAKKTDKKDISDSNSVTSTITSTVVQERPSILASIYLKSPHISEKATNLIKENKYIFKVLSDANKIQIKKAVEELYGVKVLSVNIINTKAKTRQLGKISGMVPGYKKAMVKLTQGQKLDILPQ